MFLDSVRERQEEQERERKERDGEELKNFREYVHRHLVFSFAHAELSPGQWLPRLL